MWLGASVSALTSSQVFPGDLLPATHPDPTNPDAVLARSEFERRRPYIDLLEGVLGRGVDHPLYQLLRECLHNAPQRRPPTDRLLITLDGMKTELEGPYGGLLQLDIARVQATRELKRKDRRIEQLEVRETEYHRVGLKAPLGNKHPSLHSSN